MTGEDVAPLDLLGIVQAVRQHLLWIILPPIVLVGLAAARSAAVPRTYVAKSSVLFESTAAGGTIESDRDIQDEVAVAEGDAVHAAVLTKLDRAPRLSVATSAGSNSFTLSVRDGRPDLAFAAVKAYTEAYLSVRAQRSATSEAAARSARAIVTDLQMRISDLDAEITARIVSAARDDPLAKVLPDPELTAQRGDLLAEQTALRNAAAEVEAAEASADAPTVLDAGLPTTPDQQSLALAMALAGIAGLAVGLVLALAAVALDESVRERSTVLRLHPTVRELADCTVPRRRRSEAVSWSTPRIPDGFQALQASVARACRSGGLASVQVMAPADGPVATTVAARLAAALATGGRRVVLLDTDLDDPGVRRAVCLANDQGLCAVFAEHSDVEHLLQNVREVPNLRAMTAGPTTMDERIRPKAIARLVRSIAERTDLVVIDGPSGLRSTGVATAGLVDGVVLVVVLGQTSERHLLIAAERLAVVGANVLGTVLVRESRRVGPHWGTSETVSAEQTQGPLARRVRSSSAHGATQGERL